MPDAHVLVLARTRIAHNRQMTDTSAFDLTEETHELVDTPVGIVVAMNDVFDLSKELGRIVREKVEDVVNLV